METRTVSEGFAALKALYEKYQNAVNAAGAGDDKRINQLKYDATLIINETRAKVAEFAATHFDSLTSKLTELESTLSKEGKFAHAPLPEEDPDSEEKTVVTEESEKDLEYARVEGRLHFMLSHINEGTRSLNELDFDKLIPPVTVTSEGEWAVLKGPDGKELLRYGVKDTPPRRTASVAELGRIISAVLPCLEEAKRCVAELKRLFIARYDINELRRSLNKRIAELERGIRGEGACSALKLFNDYFGESLLDRPEGTFLKRAELEEEQYAALLKGEGYGKGAPVPLGRLVGSVFPYLHTSPFKSEAENAPAATRFFYLGENPSVPLMLDPARTGNLFLDVSEDPYTVQTVKMVESYLCELALSLGRERVKFCVVDIDRKMSFSFLKELERNRPGTLFGGLIRDDRLLDDTVRDLEQKMYDNADLLEGKGSFIDCLGEVDGLCAYVLVLINFPAGFKANVAERVAGIMKNGNKNGVFTLLLNCRYRGLDYDLTPEKYSAFMKNAKECCMTLVKRSQDVVYRLPDMSARLEPLVSDNEGGNSSVDRLLR